MGQIFFILFAKQLVESSGINHVFSVYFIVKQLLECSWEDIVTKQQIQILAFCESVNNYSFTGKILNI